MSLFLSLFVHILLAQDIRLRLLQQQKSIPIVAEAIELEGKKSQIVTITYDSKLQQWLIYDGKTKDVLTSKNKTLNIQATNARVWQRKVSGAFHLVWNIKTKAIDLVYPMDIDKYLLGVVPAEMPSSWPLESLKAQAIASRSYVLAQMQGFKTRHFDVDSSVMDQVFNKSKFETLPLHLKERVRQAIQETSNAVLFSGQKIYKTYFHAKCGGHTEDPKTVWNDSWNWSGKKDPYCNLGSGFNWSYTISLEDFAHFYSNQTGEAIGKISKITSANKTVSGRSENIYIFFEDGRIRRWSSQDMREEVGFSNIKSTLFNIVLSKETVSFQGKGFGHGVGLCQFGARQMASMGKKHNEILEFYYPDSQLRRVVDWPSFLAKLQGITVSHLDP